MATQWRRAKKKETRASGYTTLAAMGQVAASKTIAATTTHEPPDTTRRACILSTLQAALQVGSTHNLLNRAQSAPSAIVGARSCTDCPASKYKSQAGPGSCIQCPSGKWSSKRQRRCKLCPKGKIVMPWQTECSRWYPQLRKNCNDRCGRYPTLLTRDDARLPGRYCQGNRHCTISSSSEFTPLMFESLT